MKTRREIADDVYETPLPREEFERRLGMARSELEGEEGAQLREMLAWFKRRYPTPLARLAYARRKFREAEQMRGR